MYMTNNIWVKWLGLVLCSAGEMCWRCPLPGHQLVSGTFCVAVRRTTMLMMLLIVVSMAFVDQTFGKEVQLFDRHLSRMFVIQVCMKMTPLLVSCQ